MDDVQGQLAKLSERGWTISSIAEAIDVPRNTVERWKRGVHQPAHAQAVGLALQQLIQRKRIPKRKRYKEKEL
jgi:transcriptional regulator with XRE-family HTH domain